MRELSDAAATVVPAQPANPGWLDGPVTGIVTPGTQAPCRPRGLGTPPGHGQPRARDRRPRASGRWLPAALGQPRFGGPDSPVRGCPPRPQALLLPIVVMTSSKEDKDVVTSYELGANSYVR